MTIEKRYEVVREEISRSEVNSFDEFTGRLERLANEEGSETEPAVKVELYFGAHGSANDAEAVKIKFDACDVYIPECFGRTDDLQKAYQTVADDVEARESALCITLKTQLSEYMATELEMIRGSQKAIMLVDMPADHPHAPDLLSSLHRMKAPLSADDTFEEAVERATEPLRTFGALQRERERYILEHFRPQLRAVIRNRTNLHEKAAISVLMRMGAVHSGLLSAFRGDGIETERSFQNLPLHFPFEHQIMRSVMFDLDASIDAVAGVLLTKLIDKAIPKFWSERVRDGTLKTLDLMGRIQHACSAAEVRELWDEMRANNFSPEPLLTMLEKKGFLFP